MNNIRELENSPIRQSVREQRPHTIQIASGITASEPAVKVFDELTGEDISAAAGVLVGSASIVAGVLTTPLIQVPKAARAYRVECWFKSGSEQLIRFFRIVADE